MSLPVSVRVKISSENVESIGLSPVVVQDMPLEELIGLMLGLSGKDATRIRELLLRGSFVSGASRFRWQGFEAPLDSLAQFLERYPNSDPSRPFSSGPCTQVVLRGGSKPVVIEREAGQKRRMLRNRSFWDEIIELASASTYVEYSYRERADVYRLQLTGALQAKVRESAKLLAYSSLERQIMEGNIAQADFYVTR